MIGIFDSGIGGLTVVKAIMESLPNYDLVYFGDTARTPYGTKSKKTVEGYTKENISFLKEKGVKMIVVACNTASSVLTPEIVKDAQVPVFEVITPAAKMASAKTKNNCVGIIGTRQTVNSGVYESTVREITPTTKVYSEPCPLLVSLVEEGWTTKPETASIVKKYILPLKAKKIDTLILGCTHYPVLKGLISQKMGKQVYIVDSSQAVAASVKEYLKTHPETDALLGKTGQYRFYVSDLTSQFEKVAKKILKIPLRLEQV